MTQRDPLITKKYILVCWKINFSDRNFFVTNLGEKNFFKIGKWNWLKMQNMTQRDALIAKRYILVH